MTSPGTGDLALVGRRDETALLDGLLAGLPRAGAALVIRGAPGVGKSALAGHVRRAAGTATVLRAAGTDWESQIPYAGLNQLLRPLLPAAGTLSPTRRASLEAAIGASGGERPECSEVAMATLELLAGAATRAPVVAVVEDVHRMDVSSVRALTFVARRLEADPVLLLLTARDVPVPPLDGNDLPALELRPLDRAAAEALLDATSPGLAAADRARVLDLARGNPLALTELPKTVGAADATHVPLTDRLEKAFAARYADLPDRTRQLLALAALQETASIAEILAAGGGAGLADLEPAAAAGLVDLRPPAVAFRHPLVRSAVTQTLSATARSAGHTALAAATSDDDRRVRHLAAAASGPDDELAAQVERLAEDALRRGANAIEIGAQTLGRAADLTVSPGEKGRRLFRSAALAYEVGAVTAADARRRQLAQLVDDETGHLRVELLTELSDGGRHGDAGRVRELTALAVRAAAAGEHELADQFVRAAALRCWVRRVDAADTAAVVALARAAMARSADPEHVVSLAYADPLGSARVVADAVRAAAGRTGTDAFLLGCAASCAGEVGLADDRLRAAIDALRGDGRVPLLARALVLGGWAGLRRGDWVAAAGRLEEGSRLARDSDEPLWQASGLAGRAMVAALRGETDGCEAYAARADRIAAPRQLTSALAEVLLARATAAAAAGEHAAAVDHLSRLLDPADPAHHLPQAVRSLFPLTVSAVQGGVPERARAAIGTVRRLLPADAPTGTVAYAEALLAPEEEFEAAVRAALAAEAGSWPYERHHLQLALGAWLRRHRRRRDARDLLRAARDGFDVLGARAWATRARDELRAAGERSEGPRTQLWDLLSPQELQIAVLAGEGLSNREIGDRLFLSHRTVGSHLYRIFPKLGVTSRAQLASVLSRSTEAGTPPRP